MMQMPTVMKMRDQINFYLTIETIGFCDILCCKFNVIVNLNNISIAALNLFMSDQNLKRQNTLPFCSDITSGHLKIVISGSVVLNWILLHH